MGKSLEKRLTEEGHTIEEVQEYAATYGRFRAMEQFGIRDFVTFSNRIGSPSGNRIPVDAVEVSGKWFQGLARAIKEQILEMAKVIDGQEQEIDRLKLENEYLRSFSDKGCIAAVKDLMSVCKEG